VSLDSFRASLKPPDNWCSICDTSSPRRIAHVDTQPTQFFYLATRYDALSYHGDPLASLASHVPWAEFRPALERVLRRSKRKQGGRPPFDAVLMFKILVLQALYNLSDDQTEYHIRDRLSFLRFVGA
jgi:hypothetical protein